MNVIMIALFTLVILVIFMGYKLYDLSNKLKTKKMHVISIQVKFLDLLKQQEIMLYELTGEESKKLIEINQELERLCCVLVSESTSKKLIVSLK